MSNPASLEASPGFFEQLAEKAESHGAGGQNDVNLENSGASVVVEDIHEWPKVNPQHVYKQIRAVTDADKGSNKNVFYTSYGKDWTKLTTQQKDKARSFFLKLPQAKQTQILMNAADLNAFSKVSSSMPRWFFIKCVHTNNNKLNRFHL